jgi:hypothetical protein
MAKIGKDTAHEVVSMEGFEGRYEELGGYTVGWETFAATMDAAPLFRGLPDDHCQSPHWGVVLAGELTFHYVDGSVDVVRPREAYYARPGHVPSMIAGTSVVEFSPTEALQQTMAVVTANVASMSEV